MTVWPPTDRLDAMGSARQHTLETVRDAHARDYPAVWARIEAKRAFMRDELGLRLRPEVLPLSSAPAYLPPFWLDPESVCVALP